MKIYLVNKNPMITKLVSLSVAKIGLDMVETQELDSSLQADVLLLDDECYKQEELEQYRQANAGLKAILFYAKSTERIEGFDAYIQKPFLPTELVRILSEVCGVETFITAESTEAGIEGSAPQEASSGAESEEISLADLEDLGLELNMQESPKSSSPKVLDENDIEEVKQLFAEDKSGDKGENKDFEAELGLEQQGDSSEEFEFELAQKDEVESEKGDLASDFEGDLSSDFEESLEADSLGDSQGGAQSELGGDLTSDLAGALEDLELDAEQEGDLEGLEVDSMELAESTEAADEAVDSTGAEELVESADEMEATETTETAPEMDFEKLVGDLEDRLEENQEGAQEGIKESVESGDLGMETEAEEIKEEDLEEEAPLPAQEESVGEELEGFAELESQESEESEESTSAMEEFAAIQEQADTGAQANEKEPTQEKGEVEEKSSIEEKEGLDEFDSLSLEAMSEALGEPIAKAPNATPIIPKEEPKEAVLPSNVQINSLESLIGALQTLQTQSLKELLSGATINISIQFPKKED